MVQIAQIFNSHRELCARGCQSRCMETSSMSHGWDDIFDLIRGGYGRSHGTTCSSVGAWRNADDRVALDQVVCHRTRLEHWREAAARLACMLLTREGQKVERLECATGPISGVGTQARRSGSWNAEVLGKCDTWKLTHSGLFKDSQQPHQCRPICSLPPLFQDAARLLMCA